MAAYKGTKKLSHSGALADNGSREYYQQTYAYIVHNKMYPLNPYAHKINKNTPTHCMCYVYDAF